MLLPKRVKLSLIHICNSAKPAGLAELQIQIKIPLIMAKANATAI